MKRIALLFAIVAATTAYQNTTPVKTNVSTSSTTSDKAIYIWYKDEEMTEETGTDSDVHIEINRLSLLFPGYTFSSNHTMGLYPYEYGYHNYLPTAIIYSNR